MRMPSSSLPSLNSPGPLWPLWPTGKGASQGGRWLPDWPVQPVLALLPAFRRRVVSPELLGDDAATGRRCREHHSRGRVYDSCRLLPHRETPLRRLFRRQLPWCCSTPATLRGFSPPRECKNPPIGSGGAGGVSFGANLGPPWTVLAMSDGVWKYAGWENILRIGFGERGEAIGDALLEAARLKRTGELQDDFTLIVLQGDCN